MKYLALILISLNLVACGEYTDENGDALSITAQAECRIRYADLLDRAAEIGIGDPMDKVHEVMGRLPDAGNSFTDTYQAEAFDFNTGRFEVCDEVSFIYTRHENRVLWIQY